MFLGASLSLVWSVINVLQPIALAPIFGKLKFPSAILLINEIMLTIAAFKFIDTGKILDAHLYYFPEEDPFTPSFEHCDYESTLLLGNASSTIWMFKLHLATMILTTIIVGIFKRICKGRCESAKKKLTDYFFLNGLIRLLMETSFELAFVAVLNIRTVNWDTPFPSVRYSNALAVFFFVLLSALSTSLVALYCIKF